jgi:hypothetical protein
VGSKQAYGLLAQIYCPRVYWKCGPVFWRFFLRLCCHRYRTVEIPSFVNRVTQLLIFFQITILVVWKFKVRIWTRVPIFKSAFLY